MDRALNAAKSRVDFPRVLRPRLRRTPVAAASVYLVYRSHNASVVTALRRKLGGAVLHAWALDVPAPSLRQCTVGSGPGDKFALICGLLAERPPGPHDHVVVADDDVVLTRGHLADLLQLQLKAGLDLAQPGHDRRGHPNYGLTVARPLSRARITSFVEIGPLFAVAPSRRDEVLAALRGAGMGYGVEQLWWELRPSLRMGVIDEVKMRHLTPAGGAYDNEQLAADMRASWSDRRVTAVQPQESYSTWHAWQGRPSWQEQREQR